MTKSNSDNFFLPAVHTISHFLVPFFSGHVLKITLTPLIVCVMFAVKVHAQTDEYKAELSVDLYIYIYVCWVCGWGGGDR